MTTHHIDDIEKLAPELLNKSRAQLEREITERNMALARLEEIEREKEKAEMLKEAQAAFDDLVAALKRFHDTGYMKPDIEAPFMMRTKNGEMVFNPGVKMKRPRG